MAKASPLISERKQPETFCLFGHSEVAFGLVVVEGNAPVGEEAQDLVAVLAQSPNEVAGWGLFGPPAGARTAGTGRIAGFGFGFGFGEDGVQRVRKHSTSPVGNALRSWSWSSLTRALAWHNSAIISVAHG